MIKSNLNLFRLLFMLIYDLKYNESCGIIDAIICIKNNKNNFLGGVSMRNFDCMYNITHEWSQFAYTLWFKDGILKRVDSSNKWTEVFSSVYREPNKNQFGINTYLLEEIVGYICRGKNKRDIKEFLELFASDKKYYSIIKTLLKKERIQMNDSINRINEAIGE